MSPSALYKSDCLGQHITVAGKTALDTEAQLECTTKYRNDWRKGAKTVFTLQWTVAPSPQILHWLNQKSF